MKSNKTIPIGITMGDPAGIGPEVIAKALDNPSLRKSASFVVIGDAKIYQRFAFRLSSRCHFIHVETNPKKAFVSGHASSEGALASYRYLREAVALLKSKKIRALVTGPVWKEGISQAGFPFQGHTEFLAKAFGVKKFGMLFLADELRTIVVTRHIPLVQVSKALNVQKILDTIYLTRDFLKKYFRLRNPRIAVCGLNPHAGEGGKIGTEEKKIISPAIRKARQKGIGIQGPFPADTLFQPFLVRQFDVVVAMYHDQGLIPLKTLHFDKLVNVTIGLPVIRTSPAHGTAFNIAGRGKADATSMLEAIKTAVLLSG